MNLERNEKTKVSSKERYFWVALSQSSCEILDETNREFKDRYVGIDLSRKKLLSWLVANQLESLTKAEEKKIYELFFDEFKYLNHQLPEIKRLAEKGEKVSIEEILRQALTNPQRANRKTQKA